MSNKQAPPFGNASDMAPGAGSSADPASSEDSRSEAVVEVSRHDTAPFDPYVRQEFAFTTQTRRTLLGLEPPEGDAGLNLHAPIIEEPGIFDGTWDDSPGSPGTDPLARNAPTVPSLRRRAALAPPGVPDVARLPAAEVSTARARHGAKGWAAVVVLALLAFGAAFAASGSGRDAATNAPDPARPNHTAVPGTEGQAAVGAAPGNAPNIESSKVPAATPSPLAAVPAPLQLTGNPAAPGAVVSASPPQRTSAPARAARPPLGPRGDAPHAAEPTRPRNVEHSEANAAKKRLWFPPE